ncbi:response regulator transcription factor [Cohnella sp. JJ-181]|uniref:response regulator transcription factor n=1 Tax=Cohnella rhizoplanae TaxID=2974897 RepID=UPI0022FF6D18|nr:response regulator [Cohnella sp. JJ-181]CAI6087048.1 Protein-glutamate methylesterase/protein-glutamine glutaminase [Cohnella sp. JJ-181]
MLKAFIVDDEKLVRKGFMSMIDWSAYGIEIVGEAADGKSALAALRTQPVDLLFTDITMPNMSGFDLIREVHKLRPRIYTVVLTCHHDFDYLQEAMRLGAIDYFVKTLMDMENMDGVMNRIVNLIAEEKAKHAPAIGEPTPLASAYGAGLYYLPLKAGMQLEPSQLPMPSRRGTPLRTEGGGWLIPVQADGSAAEWESQWNRAPLAHCLPILVTDLAGWDSERDRIHTIPLKLQDIAFYRYVPGTTAGLLRVSGSELKRASGTLSDEGHPLSRHWHEYRWLYLRKEWEKLLEIIESERPPAKTVAGLAADLLADTEPMLSALPAFRIMKDSAPSNGLWADWKRWLQDFTQLTWQLTTDRSFSPDVVISLPRAIRYMRQNLGLELNQHDVASHIHMSRSYFSRYFKQLTGESFGDFLRSLRFTYAIELLERSGLPISVVAERSGFQDDKYFSRLFRERTGKLPSEYRSANQALN